jgi:hypothetical protein
MQVCGKVHNSLKDSTYQSRTCRHTHRDDSTWGLQISGLLGEQLKEG